MLGIMLHSISFTPPVRVDQLRYDEALVTDTVCLSNSQRISPNGLYRTPDIYDLYTSLK